MKRLKPEKLNVEFRFGVTPISPIIDRHYTLTHSDITGELFLTIGLEYAYDKIGPIRDELLAKWNYDNNKYILFAYVYVDGQHGLSMTALRNRIFVKELPLALEAIRYGDRALFQNYPMLDSSPIFIHFYSMDPYFNRIEYRGTPSDYIGI
ncbi:staygreen family protein [Paramaledivibacter caminithermalis]|jgi:hypothetical protein|uniref:Staygreen protein n=1 Tax=Paramaledivibacter caminithermalis (strain DSM 15212 / CIP 107654 / DViRD3) TaxID=1121301 RepID=A0A1M6QWG9_PARC5|nr:staygreen family protein [Paramaledivibacter caminithermalis]SHK24500.1 Staygreen protein [Paramaledivibacter caminithermalis DSM 15212]